MKTYLAVAAGSVIGSVARWAAGLELAHLAGHATIFAALFVNLTGSFLIGIIGTRRDASVLWRAFAMTGICGGYTTFSAFSLDNRASASKRRVKYCRRLYRHDAGRFDFCCVAGRNDWRAKTGPERWMRSNAS